jgi:hypothetical protein
MSLMDTREALAESFAEALDAKLCDEVEQQLIQMMIVRLYRLQVLRLSYRIAEWLWIRWSR